MICITACGMLLSCSKGSNPLTPDLNKIKSAKFTVTVTGIKGTGDNDYASVVFSTAAETGSNSTVWKVNGTNLPNENVTSLSDEDFPEGGSKTYTIELTQPVQGISAGYQFINFGGPFTISYKAEINGKVVKEVTNQQVAEGHSVDADYDY